MDCFLAPVLWEKLEISSRGLLLVWSVSEKDDAEKFTGKVRRKICWRLVFSDDYSTNRKVLGDGEGDRNETRSPEGFPELMTRGNWKELGFLP